MIWLDDVIYWELDETGLLHTLDLILESLDDVGLYAAAHKGKMFETSVTWCGNCLLYTSPSPRD